MTKQSKVILPLFEPLEEKAKERGFKRIAGVDEAGRGPLAGPVVAASVIFDDVAAIQDPLFFAINDSKKLSAQKRKKISDYLLSCPHLEYHISIIDAEEIDRINILQASLKAMQIAVTAHVPLPDYVLIDGNKVFQGEMEREAVIGGDARVLSIAAASILAKVKRDELMEIYHQEYPEYGFIEHKGYGTKKHTEAIERYGLSPIHRKSFKLRELCKEA